MMGFLISLNHDGAWRETRRADTWPEAVRQAARLSGYTVRTVRDYLAGRVAGWNHPADGFVLPLKRERHRDNVAVWIFEDLH